MNSKMNVQSAKRKFFRTTVIHYFLSCTIVTSVTVAFVKIFFLVLNANTTLGDNGGVYQWLNARVNIILCCIVMLEVLMISVLYFIRLLRNMEEVIKATEDVYLERDVLIDLPPALNELEGRLNQIKVNMERKEQKVKEAEQRKNDLILYLAHDLKTPLTSVIGYLSLLQDEKDISEELREKYIGIARDKSERLEDLMNEFFEITRFNLSKLTLEISNVNLTRMVEQIAYEFRPEFEEKKLEYELQLEKDLYADCDVDKLQRVFDNLLKNAFYYSYPNTTIKVVGKSDADKVQFEVINRGKTIPKEKLNRLFEQFYRMDSARTSRTGGAGLGLAISKEIVELHHGKISVWSKEETIGFQFEIPKVRKQVENERSIEESSEK